MNQKTETYLTESRKWLEKNAGPDLDTKIVQTSLENADKAAREVDTLREKWDAATEEKRVAFLVLDETLKSAKHARKALDARKKAGKKSVKASSDTAPTKKR